MKRKPKMQSEIRILEHLTASLDVPPNTRVLVTRGDGLAPQANIPAYGVLRGAWMGGQRGALTEIQPEDDVVIENCVFFGYTEGGNFSDS